jgi:hypothetical protein
MWIPSLELNYLLTMWSMFTSSTLYSDLDLKSTLQNFISLRRAIVIFSSTITQIANLSLSSLLILNLYHFLIFSIFSLSPIPDSEADLNLRVSLNLFYGSISLNLIITSTTQIKLILSPILLLIISILINLMKFLLSPIPDSDL